jgi:hypothetical protein
MVSNTDNVRGIDKLLPTPRARVLFWALPVGLLGLFWQSPKMVSLLLPNLPLNLNWLAILLVLVSAFCVGLILLVVELCVYASQNRHSVTRHYRYYAPEMNVEWLIANAQARHYLFLVVIFVSGCVVGKYF